MNTLEGDNRLARSIVFELTMVVRQMNNVQEELPTMLLSANVMTLEFYESFLQIK